MPITFDIAPGAISNQLPNQWLEPYGQGHYPPLTQRAIKAGDTIIVRMKWQASPECVAYYQQTLRALQYPTLQVRIQHAAVQDAQNFYLHDTSESDLEICAVATKDATDDLRVFIVFYGYKFGTNEPPTPHSISLLGESIYHVPAN